MFVLLTYTLYIFIKPISLCDDALSFVEAASTCSTFNSLTTLYKGENDVVE